MDHIPQDNFNQVGEGCDGSPKTLPHGVVEYLVFVVDSRLSDIQTRERLQGFQRALSTLEKKFLKEYIWQRDGLKLALIRQDGRWVLKGSTDYGDCLADEWLIVYLLRELSKEFKDAWIRIYEAGGEFLLSEADKAIPKWLTEEVDENRVWINNHRLLIIPLSKGDNNHRPLKEMEALEILRETPALPQYYPNLDKEVFHELNTYPAAIAGNQHHATLHLPRKAAYILHTNPGYIAPIVEAFSMVDPVSLRLIQPDKSKTVLDFPPEDFVEVSVRFTKNLYAHLQGQWWSPPAPWGAALENLVDKSVNKFAVPLKKAEISIKVIAGLEMLVHHKMYADEKAVREIQLLLDDLKSGDDTLPTDKEVATWPKRDDDESWLNIDFAAFERELAGESRNDGFGDKGAQENLKKMVERTKSFFKDDETDDGGTDGPSPTGEDDDSAAADSDQERRGWEDPEDSEEESQSDNEKADGTDKYADAEYEEYEKAFEEFMALPAAEKELLTDEARELALAQEAERAEDEEIKKLSDMIGAELLSHGALARDATTPASVGTKSTRGTAKGKGKARPEDIPEEEEFEDELLDDDYNLADNMLKSFKAQAGLPGPAGNLMGLMGIQFPLDADDGNDTHKKGETSSSSRS
ncbi:SGT1 protein-domain-containing protein [Massariosphaeria phaeospora]|uniref:SGT1 protein-domain-containing protein n=1 Tax=Massariosphaeria phaeospora TaxID=100035 RepID=A0A7C8I619_9PLEO|nr:SGT1 protein-domain-containing protein [Massariosphaeria phaeospora]